MNKPRYRTALIDWTMEPSIHFRLPQRRLSKDLMALLDALSADNMRHPIIEWLNVFKNPNAAFRRAFIPIRRASDGPIYRRQSNDFCEAEAVEGLVRKFQGYLNEFQLRVVVCLDVPDAPELRLRCPETKRRIEFRLLSALLAIVENGDIGLVRRCAVCNKWMHARQQNQIYDSIACRQEAWQHVPEVKQKRNRDRARRYRDEQERDRRALERVRK